jgi:phage-related protein
MLSSVVNEGKKILTMLVSGISSEVSKLKEKMTEIKDTIVDKVKEIPSKLISIGVDIVKGIWQGISNGTTWIKTQIRSWVGNVTDFIKRVFKIGSPSKLMADEVGQYLAQGIGVGFSDEMKDVSSQMADAIPSSFEMETTVKGSKGNTAETGMVNAFKQALSEMKIELDDQTVGQFVDKTVSRLVYT